MLKSFLAIDWLQRRPASGRVEPLHCNHDAQMADIHAASFSRPWNAMEFERLLSERTSVADGLFIGAALSGFVLSRCVIDEAEVLTIAIAPESRCKGLARPLLAAHLDALTRKGARRVFLEVDEGNTAALALYRRFGFKQDGRREGYYSHSDGSRAAALTMSLAL